MASGGRRQGPGRTALPLALALVAGGVTVLALVWLDASDGTPETGPGVVATASPDDLERAPADTATAKSSPELPDGLLPPLLGPPRASYPTLCDEDRWKGLSDLVRDVRDGDVVVAEPQWQRMGVGTQGGVASWLSKCKHAGRPIRIRGAESGALLATYAATTGFHAAD